MIPKEILQQTAKKKGLVNKEHIEKDYFQDLLLFNIYKKTNLLVFKGGTALYKLYQLPRFSEDLDFSLLENKNIEKIISEIVGNIGGAEIKEFKTTKKSLLVKIQFKGIITSYNTVRLDINLKNDILEKFDVRSYTSNYIDIPPFSLRILNLKEVLAEKIHCLLMRERARDLFDLFFLLKFVKVDKELINKKLAIFAADFDYKNFERRINNIKEIWEKELSPFVLSDLPDFKMVKSFVLENIKSA